MDASLDDRDDGVEYEPEDFRLGSFSFSVTTIAFMPIETLMANQGKTVEISGQKLWCGSLAVAEYLLGSGGSGGSGGGRLEAGVTVVELGAGTGVLGMLCKRLGAGRVLLTDNDARSLRHMRQDCARNNVEAEVVALDWFSPNVGALLPPPPGTAAAGTTVPPLLVVAGDVLYKQCLLEPFMATARAILAAQVEGAEAQMLLCHVPRAGVQHEDVQAAACAAGLATAAVERQLWLRGSCLEYCPAEDTDRAVVYRVTLASAVALQAEA